MAALDLIVGGYSCQFVESVPRELQIECSICLYTVRDPHLVDCCGYRFCKTCIDPLKPSKRCPLCNCRFTAVIPDKLLQRTLNEKRVYCTHNVSGCKWIGELAVLDKHLNAKPERENRMEGCLIQKVKCKHIFCNDEIQRNQLESHELSCPKRVVVCEYCKTYRAIYSEVVQHYSVCLDLPVNCPNDGCEAKVKRSNVTKHVSERCPYTTVTCEYAYAGCEVSLTRKTITEHLESTTKHHLDLLTSHCAKQKSSLDQLLSELQDVKLEVAERSESSFDLLKELLDLRCDDNSDSNCEVLVSNLPVVTDEHMIKGLFGQHGQVDRIEFYPINNMAVVEYKLASSVDRLFNYQKSLAKGLRLRGSKLTCIRLSY